MNTKITVVVDNISDNGMCGEWGLCLLVEYKDKKILVDAGASDLFLENLKKLGFNVEDIDFGILSHAHYDHANGIPGFFEKNPKAPFYFREGTKPNCYSQKKIFKKYIGIPKKVMSRYPDRIRLVSGDHKLMEGAYLIPHKTEGLEDIGKKERMYQKTPKGWKPDDFVHEQSLVLETDKGLVIINSCSHGGAANIINEVQNTFPDKKVYGIIGGFHLFNKTDEEVKEFAKKVNETGIEYVCTGHCTKEHGFEILKEELGDKAQQMRVGFSMEF